MYDKNRITLELIEIGNEVNYLNGKMQVNFYQYQNLKTMIEKRLEFESIYHYNYNCVYVTLNSL